MSTNPNALLNLAEALSEDVLKTSPAELIREVMQDFGEPHALANQFDELCARAKREAGARAHD
jgi:hypothetical protein